MSDPVYRAELVSKQDANSDLIDGTILKLSSGALALSLAMIKEVSPVEGNSRFPLLMSWLLFAAAILLVILDTLRSQAVIRAKIKENDAPQAAEIHGVQRANEKTHIQPDYANSFTDWALGCFAIGLSCTIYYVGTNLPMNTPPVTQQSQTAPATAAAHPPVTNVKLGRAVNQAPATPPPSSTKKP